MLSIIQRLLLVLLILMLLVTSMAVVLAGEPPGPPQKLIPLADDCGDTCDKVPDSPVVVQGATLRYTIHVTNVAATVSVGKKLFTDTIPPGTAFKSVSGTDWKCTCLPGTCSQTRTVEFVRCEYPDALAPDQGTRLFLELDLLNPTSVVTNTATFGFPLPGGNQEFVALGVTQVVTPSTYLPLIQRNFVTP